MRRPAQLRPCWRWRVVLARERPCRRREEPRRPRALRSYDVRACYCSRMLRVNCSREVMLIFCVGVTAVEPAAVVPPNVTTRFSPRMDRSSRPVRLIAIVEVFGVVAFVAAASVKFFTTGVIGVDEPDGLARRMDALAPNVSGLVTMR